MRVDVVNIHNILNEYFYINKFDIDLANNIISLLNVESLCITNNCIDTIDIMELLNSIDNVIEKNKKNEVILADIKEEIHHIYDTDKYIYATLPVLKSKVAFKKDDIMNNPNIKNMTEEHDYDIGCVRVTIQTIDGGEMSKFVMDWKSSNKIDVDRKLLYVFGQTGSDINFRQSHIIKANEYSK